jgi:hypothetical protein
MSPRKTRIIGGLAAVVAFGIAVPVLFTPSEACACVNPAKTFLELAFDADLVESSEAELRSHLRARYPVGSSFRALDEIRHRMWGGRDPHGICVEPDGSLHCQLVLESSAFDFYWSEIDVEVMRDRAGRIAGHRVVKRRWLLGMQL